MELVTHCEASSFELVLAFPADDAYDFYDRNAFTRQPDPVVRRFEP